MVKSVEEPEKGQRKTTLSNSTAHSIEQVKMRRK
jgi:hypothetical protein